MLVSHNHYVVSVPGALVVGSIASQYGSTVNIDNVHAETTPEFPLLWISAIPGL